MKESTSFVYENDRTVFLTAYPGDKNIKNKLGLIILPGGGYNTCAPFEGEPVALKFESMGYACFVLNYSAKYASFEDMIAKKNENLHTVFPEPLKEVSLAFEYIVSHADEYGVDAKKISVIGFSAGGHLAANYAVYYDNKETVGNTADIRLKPFVTLLGYGASEMTKDEMVLPSVYGKRDSYPEELLRKYSAKYFITKDTSPMFIFHSVTDPMVPVKESIDMADALNKAEVPYEIHLFGQGAHAYSIAEGKPYGIWVSLADTFIHGIAENRNNFEKQKVKEEHFKHMKEHGGKED